MRLRRFDLIRYGIFSDRSIEFRPDAALHVVLGPNESGKTTALAAITDLLYGIEPRTAYAFRHEPTSLRVGAKIDSAKVGTLEFVRRKGNKGTLLDPAGISLPDDALLPYIGAVSRDVFIHAFGLNREKLKAGAREMLQSDGETGNSIFVAASGLKALSKAQAQVRAVADGILGSRRSRTRVFDQNYERYESARKLLRDVELTVGDWTASRNALKGLEEKHRDLNKALEEKRAESNRLARLKRVWPIMQRLNATSQALVDLALNKTDGSTIPNAEAIALESKLEEALHLLDTCQRDADRTETEFELEGSDLDGIPVNETLLGKKEVIQRLLGRSGSYDDQLRDLPRIESERDEKLGAIAGLAHGIGIPIDRADKPHDPTAILESGRPDVATLETVRVLAEEGRTLRQEVESLGRTIAKEQAGLDANQSPADQENSGHPVDPRGLRQRFLAFAPVLGNLQKLEGLQTEIAAEETKISEAALRLRPPVADISTLTALPRSSVIEEAQKNIITAEQALSQERVRLQDAIKERTQIEKRVHALGAGQTVPSLESIEKARAGRNSAWLSLRGKLEGAHEEPTGAALAETIRTFEHGNRQADELADHAIRDAGTVERYSIESELLNGKALEVAEYEKSVALKEEGSRLTDNEWQSLWKESGFVPLSPPEMATWLSNIEGLLQRRATLLDKIKERDGIENSLREAKPGLEDLANDLMLEGIRELSPPMIARRIEDHLDEMEKAWQEQREADSAQRERTRRLAGLEADEQAAKAKLESWQDSWSKLMTTVGLKADALIEAAVAALSVWGKLSGEIEAYRSLRRRVDGMNRDKVSFEDEVRSLVADIAPDLTSIAPRLAIDQIGRLFNDAQSAKDRRDEAEKRRDKAARSYDIAKAALEKAQSALADAMAPIAPGVDGHTLLERVKRHNQRHLELAADRQRFIEQADGHSEEDVRKDLADYDADGVAAQLAALSADELHLRGESEATYAEIKVAATTLGNRETSVEAERVNQMKRSAEAALAQTARTFISLRLEDLLLSAIIERQRASQNSPLLRRAGELFRMITGGAFSGLIQQLDDNDVPAIMGCRRDDTLVSLSRMTSGTIDQLYLALRLAYLEDFASRQETPPFIGDDLFESSDENRTRNGLVALAELSIQPIVFTHHQHVAEIATTNLGDRVDVVKL